MTYIERRIMLNPFFVTVLENNWPAELPTDCTKMDGDSDCLDRVDPKPCASCDAYDELAFWFDKGYRSQEVQS